VLFDNAAGVPVFPPFTTSRLLPENFKQRQQLYTATLNWDLGPATLTSATGYSRSSSTVTADASVNFLPIFGVLAAFSTPIKLEKVTQEIRLASPIGQPLQWLIGGFFTQENGLLGQVGTAYDPASLAELPPPINPLLDASLPSHYREFALFGDATYRVTDALDLDLGLRWARNDQDFQQILTGLLVGPPTDLPGSSSDDVVTYSGSVRYHFSPDVMAYGRVATGYRPGGPNLAIPGVPATFGPDTLTNYEAGLKSEFLDRRLLVDVTVFHIDWNEIQTSASTPLGISYLTNAGAAKSDGLELTVEVAPVSGLRLGGGLALTNARLSGDTPEANAIGGFDGDRLPLTPKTSASLTASYEFPLSGSFSGRIGGVYRFVGERETRFPHAPNDSSLANPEAIRLASYQAVDLNAAVLNDRWTLSLFVRNLFGEQAFISGGLGSATVLQPRTVGVSLDAKF
jgi:outer membrane receptor protein involved in Fe transport